MRPHGARWPAVVATALLASFQFGYHMAVLNPASGAGALSSDLAFPPTSALPSSSLLAGAILGSLLGGTLADAFGPVRSLTAVGAVFTLGSLGCASSTSLAALVAARAATGVAVGAASAVPPRVIADAAPPSLRGPAGAAHQVVICAGIVVAMLAGLPYDDVAKTKAAAWAPWRVALAAAALPGAALTFLATVCTESPAWLAAVGRDADAAAAAAALGAKPVRGGDGESGDGGGDGDTDASLPASSLTRQGSGALVRQGSGVSVATPRAGAGAAPPGAFSPRAVAAIPATFSPSPAETAPLVVDRAPPPPPSWRAIVTRPALRRPLLLALSLAVSQQASGINVVILYSTSVLAAAGVTRAVAAGAAVAAVNAVASAVAAAGADKVGRRRALIGSHAAMSVCLALLALALASPSAPPAASVAALVAYVCAFAAGAGPVTWLYLGEIAPAARVLGAAAAVNWAAAAAVAFTWPHAAAMLGVAGGYAGYAFLNAAAASWAAAAVVETAGRSLEEVRAVIAGGGSD